MDLKRRTFLGGTLAVAAGAAGTTRSAGPLPAPARATLRAVVDTLLPGDGGALPAASALGVDGVILDELAGDAGFAAQAEKGLAWFEAQAAAAAKAAGGNRTFAALDVDSREAIMGRAFAAARGSPPELFCRRLRQRAFRAYYTRPEGWAGLGFDRPPQPEGYPDQDRPPTSPGASPGAAPGTASGDGG
ncbi:MAG: gluconate 2-dehydrogenase subunit 3 family protein [Hyphomicrobiales bacterium]|nr:gluconate 2-dehydrogenase subunit 3 family protein [Hyphomicrobiales bacterium]